MPEVSCYPRYVAQGITMPDRSPFGEARRPEKLAAAVKRWKELRPACKRYTGMCYTCERCAFEACPFVAWWVRKGYAETRGLEYASMRTGDWYG